MKTAQDYRNLHRDATCFILARGPSINNLDLTQLHDPGTYPHYRTMPKVIGLNNTWELAPCDYTVVAELGWLDKYPDIYSHYDRQGSLFVVGAPPYCKTGIGVPAYCHPDSTPPPEPFSLSPAFGVVLGWNNVGSVAYVALQIAVWMGFSTINFLGLDLTGPHFDGTPATPDMSGMNRLFVAGAQYLAKYRPELQVFNVGSPHSHCTAFPHRTYADALKALEWSVTP